MVHSPGLRLAFVYLAAPLLLLAGEIRLQVNDPSGSAMQASGKLRSLTNGIDRSFRTDARGVHTLSGLTLGRYRIDISASGFATRSLSVDVPNEVPVPLTVTLSLAASSFQTEVVGTTPLAGVDLAREEIAAPVQSAGAGEIEASGALDLSDFLNRRLNGVHINEVQGNPLQADINYRGYTASPLLGTPQGLSIYMDGVRLNQPFGDVVNWDLIPRIAIAEATLMPGSNPLFGLNTLGGALSLQTKDGRSRPGATLQLSGGSWGRKTRSSNTAALIPKASTGISPATSSSKMAGARNRLPTCANSSASSAGSAPRPRSDSLRCTPTTRSKAMALANLANSRATIRASTPSPTSPRIARPPQPARTP